MSKPTFKELEECIKRMMRSFPTDGDLHDAGWEPHQVEEAMQAYDQARNIIMRLE